MCDRREIEDEFHFVLVCPCYTDIRAKYIQPFFYRRASFSKLILLFNSRKLTATTNLCKYLYYATDKRKVLMS